MKRRSLILLLSFAAVLIGCTARYIAEYDENVDRGVVSLQAKFSALFDDLQRTAGTPDGAYERYAARYDDLRAGIAHVQSHASVQSRNQLTSTSLALLSDSLDELQSAHREGIKAGEVPVLRSLIDTQLRMLVQLEVAKKRDEGSVEVTQ